MANSQNIFDKGGNKQALAILGTSFALAGSYTSGTDCIEFGQISESDMSTSLSKDKKKSEDGIVRYTESTRDLETTVTLMERDKTHVDFFAFTILNTTVLHYRYAGIVNVKKQEYWSLQNADAQVNIKTPGGATSNKYTGTHISPDSAVTYTAGAIAVFMAAVGVTRYGTGSVVIPLNAEFYLQET